MSYIPGLTNQLADCLSHLGGQKDTIKLPISHAYHITNQLCARSDSLQQIRIATQEDDELALLKHTITQGWPCDIKDIPSVIQSYWTFQGQLTHRRWNHLERHKNCYTCQEMGSCLKAYT